MFTWPIDFLAEKGYVIDMEKGLLKLGEEIIPLRSSPNHNSPSIVHCICAETIIIPGCHEMEVPAIFSGLEACQSFEGN